MRSIATFFLFLLFTGTLFAQNSLKISGRATDGTKPLEGATVSLHSADSATLQSVAANKEGIFELPVPSPGKYLFSISAVGFKTKWTGAMDIKSSSRLPDFALVSASQKLDEEKINVWIHG